MRKTGSYIYEEFMPTDGTDVKVRRRRIFQSLTSSCFLQPSLKRMNLTGLQVYTVGPDYAHAEARKSPALDGKVERDSEGKEVRYPVMLSAMEKLVARKVCLAFKVSAQGRTPSQHLSSPSTAPLTTTPRPPLRSKLSAASTSSGPTDTRMCATSTASAS